MELRKPRHTPGYQLEQLDGEVLLAQPATTRTIYLNETAFLIWRLCNGQHTTVEITQLLQAAFPDAAATIADDVETTLRHLLESAAIEFV